MNRIRRLRLCDLYGIDTKLKKIENMIDFLNDLNIKNTIIKAKQEINKSNKEVYLANLK